MLLPFTISGNHQKCVSPICFISNCEFVFLRLKLNVVNSIIPLLFAFIVLELRLRRFVHGECFVNAAL